MACPEYDKTAPLLNGEVKAEGIELSFIPVRPAEAHRMALEGDKNIDISEMSISHYMISKSMNRETNFTAIPVFPMRSFFYTQLLYNVDSGIDSPGSIKGKKIGVQEYGMSLALWIRGVLQHEFGVLPTDVEWFLERGPGQRVGDALGFTPPGGVKISQVRPGSDLMTMLENGEIDIAFPYPGVWRTGFDAAKPDTNEAPGASAGSLRPLFSDPKAEGIRYFRKTGIFPINHLIVVRDEILEHHPWVYESLLNSFERSKAISYSKSMEMSQRPNNFVWLDSLLDEVNQIFGSDPFPYGIKANEKVIEAAIQFSFEQGLSKRKLSISELFASG